MKIGNDRTLLVMIFKEETILLVRGDNKKDNKTKFKME